MGGAASPLQLLWFVYVNGGLSSRHVYVAGKGLRRGGQQGEGNDMCVRMEEPLGNPYICIDVCRTFKETLPKMSTPCVFV